MKTSSTANRLWRPPALLAILLWGAAWLTACGGRADAQGPPQAPLVSVVPAVARTISDSEVFSGRLEAAEYVELRPRVGGVVEKVHFEDGEMVSKGRLLFTIDPRPFEAEVAKADSQLTAARSRAELATIEVVRAQKLLDAKAVSRQEFDQLASSSRTSDADIRTAESALQVARLNLSFTTVRAPIAGRASRANITAGNLVNEQVILTSIAGVSKMRAYFDGSEQIFLRIKAAGEKDPEVRMGLSNEAGFPHTGTLDFVDNQINPQTGAIRLRASFDNSQGQFVPGLAARLTMATSSPYAAVMVPERAIGTDQSKKFVVVVGVDGQPQFRGVQLGPLQDGMRVVGGGQLKAGENVVVDGLQRIIPGVPVASQVLKVDTQGMPLPATQAAASGQPSSTSATDTAIPTN